MKTGDKVKAALTLASGPWKKVARGRVGMVVAATETHVCVKFTCVQDWWPKNCFSLAED